MSESTRMSFTATHCATLHAQHRTALHCTSDNWRGVIAVTRVCISQQQTATHSNTLQHTATHCNTLQHTATHCNTLQHTATHCTIGKDSCNVPHVCVTAAYCSTQQRTAPLTIIRGSCRQVSHVRVSIFGHRPGCIW